MVVTLASGAFICSDGEDNLYGSSVTVYDQNGEGLGHWTADEWASEPEQVMGAIMAQAASPYRR